MTPPFHDSACPEKQLLAYCARTRIREEPTQKIKKLLDGPLDWDYLLDEAEENSVTPLLERSLRAISTEAVPYAAMERLKNVCHVNTVRCLFLTAELIRILNLFRSNGIQAIPYKGPVLAAQAYGDIALREFVDLDIILRHRDLPKAHEAMLGLAYRPKFDWILSPNATAALVPCEYSYIDEARLAMVELQTEISLRHFPAAPDLDDFLQHLIPVTLIGHPIETFAVVDLLPILCIHGSKDFWTRLSWIADISELVQAYPALDWDEVLGGAKALNAGRMLHLGLALGVLLLEMPLPPEILQRVRNDRVAFGIASQIADKFLHHQSSPLNATGRFRFRRHMLPGTFEGWRYAMRLTLVPAEEDWLMMRLPRSLAPLYLVLRPLRLLHKYGWANRRAL